ncbi:hypothetical protein MAM1_0236d08511 [Mucor ambiguus]|uniref:Uncharacterized protein n=1 Tax=Mucor ambiguus TaxID=91626 RepID=A0A0C9ME58_9FUNG|nr:hypothetical protein MAM1_0236d08511 [Mucor ambiguus]
MLRLISFAMFALMGLSSVANAAPTHANAMAMNESPSASASTAVMNWSQKNIEDILSARLAEAMDKDAMFLVKRADEPISLDTLFRGLFDNIINHIIEVTPLNDIVHGNYDFLYQLFLTKVQEIITGVTNGDAPAPSDEGDSEFDENDAEDDDDENDEDDDGDDDEDEDEDDEDDEDNEEDEDDRKHWRHNHDDDE